MDTQNSLPQWTAELTDTFVTGEDQLGVEGAAQGYQQWLIPVIREDKSADTATYTTRKSGST